MHIETLNFSMDINGDGVYSRWEIWQSVVWLYRLPGNLVMEGLGNIPGSAELLGIHASPATGYASLNGPVAVALSLVFWLALVIGLVSLTSVGTRTPKRREIPLLPWTPDHKILPHKGRSAY